MYLKLVLTIDFALELMNSLHYEHSVKSVNATHVSPTSYILEDDCGQALEFDLIAGKSEV